MLNNIVRGTTKESVESKTSHYANNIFLYIHFISNSI